MRPLQSLVLDIILEVGIGHGFEKLSDIILRYIGQLCNILIAEITVEIRLDVLNDIYQTFIEQVVDLLEILFIFGFAGDVATDMHH